MGGKTNHSQASRTIIDNTLTASGRIAVYQDGDPFAVSINAGSAKIGKVDISYVADSSPIYYPLTIAANTVGGTWVTGFWNDVNQINLMTVFTRITTAATPNTITTDFRLEWSHDQSATNNFESLETYGTPASGIVQATRSAIIWTVPSGTIGYKDQSPTIKKKGRYFRIHARNSATSSTATVLQFEIQNLGNF